MAGTPFLDFYTQLLNEQPELAYNAALYGQNLTPNQRRYGQNAYQDVWSEYLGRLGQQIQQGQAPTLQFTDFLPQQSFAQRYQQQTPQQRGDFSQRYAPRTRWLTGF